MKDGIEDLFRSRQLVKHVVRFADKLTQTMPDVILDIPGIGIVPGSPLQDTSPDQERNQ